MTKFHRGSILCPNCKKLISANEARCPHCGIANPGSWWKNLKLWELLSTDQIIWAIVYLNVGMYIFSLLLNPISSGLSLNPFALLSPANKSLLLLGATGTVPIDRLHRWWTLVSANYLHGGIFHILFNMIAFRQLGPFVLREYGAYRMFVIYTLSGVIGFFISYLAGVSFTIGASASVCGLIGATLYYSKSRGGIYGQVLFRQIGGWALSIFIFGLLMPGINNWGHGGGILSGIILGFLLGYQDRVKEGLFHSILAGMCGLVTALVLVWAIFSSLYYRVAG
ncbi:MAG TPA: rhomboid family intramembrane serine protease [Desulfatiglandales bacterium]|nr:rhomboid family intramembrane serine protease [Desulfatiglandales bacterium]